MEYGTRPSHRNGMMRTTRVWRVLGAAGAVALSSGLLASRRSTQPAPQTAPLPAPPSAPSSAVQRPDSTLAIVAVVRALTAASADAHDAPLVAMTARFYADRQYRFAWTTAEGYTTGGESLRRVMHDAAEHGLDTAAYRVPAFDHASADARARADVRLSFVALRFAQDLGWGVTLPDDVHRDHAYPRRAFRGDSLLHAWLQAPEGGRDAGHDAGHALLDVAPASPGYRRLHEALRRLRAVTRQGEWESLPHGPALRPGAVGSRVAQLRRLLEERGDLAESPAMAHEDELFDNALAAAVARFQARHGLVADSVVGGATAAALNVPASSRLAQLQLGMERARWLPPVTGGRWITVNLADYHAFVFDEGVPVFRTRVIIGTTTNKTPMFVDTLTNIVFNPAWNVPPSIAAKEILPTLRRDPSYLARNHMVRTNGGIQQLPGPWNALGQVAFMFPNRFNVYMHDTPARELFEAPDRAHSHGCIRVQRPRELAALLLAHEGWSPARIDSVIATGQRTVTWLRQPIPVRITYVTAFSDDDGVLQFRPDVYGRDALLQRAMRQAQGRPLPAALS